MQKKISKENIDFWFTTFREHLDKSFEKHGSNMFNSTHEGLGVITEEYYELIEAVKLNDTEKVAKESLDVMGSAMWLFISAVENDNLESR